jgi:hypothetical protein
LVVLIGLGSFLNLFEIALGSFLGVLLGAQSSLSNPGPVDDHRSVVLRRDGYAFRMRGYSPRYGCLKSVVLP